MTLPAMPADEGREQTDRPDGMLDYECRTIIRDLIRTEGFEKAREKIAFFLMDEAYRRPS